MTNRSYAVAVVIYTTDGFRLNILFEMLDNSGVTVEETLIKDQGFPPPLELDHLEELRNGQGLYIDQTMLSNGTVTLVVNSSTGMPTGGNDCFSDEECGHGSCSANGTTSSRCVCEWGWTGPACLRNALARGGVDEAAMQYVGLVLQNEQSEFTQAPGESLHGGHPSPPPGATDRSNSELLIRTSMAFFQAYHHSQPLAATGRPQPPPVDTTLLAALNFDRGTDSANASAGSPLVFGAASGAAAGFEVRTTDDRSAAPPPFKEMINTV